jgi:hypothetical protein
MSGPVITLALPSSGTPATPRRAVVGPVLVLAVALGSLALAVVVASSQATWAWLLGGIGVALLPWALDALVTTTGRRGRLRLRTEEGATEVVGSPWSGLVDVAGAVVLVGALVGGLLALVDGGAGSRGQTRTTGTPGLDTAAPVAVLALLALLAFLAFLGVLSGRRRRSRLRLGVDGLEVTGPGGLEFFEWQALTGLRTAPTSGALTVRGLEGTSVNLPAQELRSQPVLVARLVEHYRTQRPDRPELADGRAIDRVREDRLAPYPGSD